MDLLTPSDAERLHPSGLIYLANVMRTNQDIGRWSQALRQWRPPRTPLRVHLENNSLDEHDAAEILQAIGGDVQAVYLHHNNIRSLEPLTPFIEQNWETLKELHLSHNRLSTTETKALLLLLGCTKVSAAGAETAGSCSWLRLELNHIDVDGLLEQLPSQIKNRLQLSDRGCTPRHCCCQGRRYTKHINCKFLTEQRTIMPEHKIHHRDQRREPAPSRSRCQDDEETKDNPKTVT
ncbi:mdh [Symbiodinium sp. CCMP2592]|nr:mdh [Symbiodinium sp. CCMP2592]